MGKLFSIQAWTVYNIHSHALRWGGGNFSAKEDNVSFQSFVSEEPIVETETEVGLEILGGSPNLDFHD